MNDTEIELKELLAERAISGVLLTYCQGVDRRSWDQIRDCYHPGAIDSHGAYVGDVDGLIAWLRKRHDHVLSSVHHLSNVSVRFTADHRFARVESYCLSMQVVDPSSGDAFAGTGDEPVFTEVMSRYVDTFEHREDGGWRIWRRDCVFDWMRRRNTGDFVEIDKSWTPARRDEHDLLFAPLPPTDQEPSGRP
ncbi:nuclear transport factor 2 family protein [Saccharopolyspora mangrovi]|uniref:Nuclear transport factor 2 family protein n=1 Tax=Saccharopolyspora mangrovi TaxID=3082379 RepID=A0ABU6AK39_9PSEU|nr:nuclear transport factor 2 family protein [Saccharopolyspora sp. S2-29]MEB3371886.1 nuclear transport factor 2 family protein [Saccharopolyspora sp. S2-29]